MKYIRLCEDVALVDRMTGEPWAGPSGREPVPIMMAHKIFLRGRLCDIAFGRGYERARAQLKIDKAVDEALVFVPVEDSDHAILMETILSPHPDSPFIPNIIGSLVPFMDAVKDAPSELPEAWQKEHDALLEKNKEAGEGEPDGKSGSEPPPAP
ncbi:MAG: hypothetical protein JRD89_07920 [Deltaproteobacteria bacterium]|nr:hypothetical protein [Deltaproteobacteria bacterium]